MGFTDEDLLAIIGEADATGHEPGSADHTKSCLNAAAAFALEKVAGGRSCRCGQRDTDVWRWYEVSSLLTVEAASYREDT